MWHQKNVPTAKIVQVIETVIGSIETLYCFFEEKSPL